MSSTRIKSAIAIPGVNLDNIIDLTLEGGGARGAVYAGVLNVLNAQGYLQKLKTITGSSAGGIMAFLLMAGYTSEEIESIIYALDFSIFHDKSMMNKFLDTAGESGLASMRAFIATTSTTGNVPAGGIAALLAAVASTTGILPKGNDTAYHRLQLGEIISLTHDRGLYDGNVFLEFSRDLLRAKKLPPDLTFRQLRILIESGSHPALKDITLTGTNISLSNNPLQLFSLTTTPDVEIVDALRATMSFPLVFKPYTISIDGHDYEFIDGGVRKNLVLNSNKSQTLALAVDSELEITGDKTRKGKADLADIMLALLQNDDQAKQNYTGSLMQIYDAGIKTLEFDLTLLSKLALVLSGEFTTTHFIKAKKTGQEFKPEIVMNACKPLLDLIKELNKFIIQRDYNQALSLINTIQKNHDTAATRVINTALVQLVSLLKDSCEKDISTATVAQRVALLNHLKKHATIKVDSQDNIAKNLTGASIVGGNGAIGGGSLGLAAALAVGTSALPAVAVGAAVGLVLFGTLAYTQRTKAQAASSTPCEPDIDKSTSSLINQIP